MPIITLMPRFNLVLLLCLGLLLAACGPPAPDSGAPPGTPSPTTSTIPSPTPMPTRRAYDPGELVDYRAQMGDTLPGLAARFNTTVAEIRTANPIIPDDATTMPTGLPMQIPIYYRPFWGSQYQIIPDSLFVNGPAQIDFDTAAFLAEQVGWLSEYRGTAGQQTLSGADMVDLVSVNFSVSPRLLLALLEYQTQALSEPLLNPDLIDYPLGKESQFHQGVYLQLVWAANTLNNGYYGWRAGKLLEFDLSDGRIYRPDPWQNAATVALQYFYNQVFSLGDFELAVSPEGLAATYASLFGNPWEQVEPHIPGSLQQPELRFPFPPGETWSFTGGPHTGWGDGEPWAALDFAPGLQERGCVDTDAWATAVADGLVVRTAEGTAVLDLDSDGDERTGWVIFYLHLAETGRVVVGRDLLAGQPMGHPSCEGGSSTGTHVHVARKYNGEWILASGALPFVMEGWTPHDGSVEYEGTLTRFEETVIACTCSDQATALRSTAETVPFPTPLAQGTATPTP